MSSSTISCNIKHSTIVNRKSTLLHEISKYLSQVPDARRYGDEEDVRLRSRLLALDGICEYCRKRPATTTDHFAPLVRNQAPTVFCDDVWNCIPCCKECNSSKGGRFYDEWFESTCKYNPCDRSTAATQHRSRDVWRKFAAYDIVFRVRCVRKNVDDVWWRGMRTSVERFLQRLQRSADLKRHSVATDRRLRSGSFM